MRCFLIFTLLPLLLNAQFQEYSAENIDKALLIKADAVIRLDEKIVTISAYDAMRVTSKRVVTILNENGVKHINAYALYDNNSKIKALSATILNAQGIEIKKIKAKEFVDQSATGEGTLYSDSRVKFINYTPVNYPFTVVFNKAYSTADTAFLPKWHIAEDYNVSLENSRFFIEFPPEVPFRVKENNLESYGIEKIISTNKLEYRAQNISAIQKEEYAPALAEITPWVKFAMERFQLKGIDGSAQSWNDFGKWIYESLLKGKDKLPITTVEMIQTLVGDNDTPIEKVRKIYDFLQNNTRYISVQLGIGGWMPISALEVDKVKYGDCKGLTNYTKALLKTVGIESFYTVVYADSPKRNIDEDFPSLQGNHVFLNVPLEEEEVWLECTNQQVPVNYLGTFTDDRVVLKVTPQGGEIVRSRKYDDSENRQITKADIFINSNGRINATVEITSSGTQYGQKYNLPQKTKQALEEHYKRYWSYINAIELFDVAFENNKQSIYLREKISLSTSSYLTPAGEDFLLTTNMFNRNLYVPKRNTKRQNDLIITRGYLNEDEFTIHIPNDYSTLGLIKPINLSTEFGEFTVSMEQIDAQKFLYKRKLLIKSGVYSKSKYYHFREFRKKIAVADNIKIALTKT